MKGLLTTIRNSRIEISAITGIISGFAILKYIYFRDYMYSIMLFITSIILLIILIASVLTTYSHEKPINKAN